MIEKEIKEIKLIVFFLVKNIVVSYATRSVEQGFALLEARDTTTTLLLLPLLQHTARREL